MVNILSFLIFLLVSTHHSISMLGSKLTWDEVDKHLQSIGFKERSKYIQYLVEKDIYRTKQDFKQILVIVILLLLAMMSVAILLKV